MNAKYIVTGLIVTAVLSAAGYGLYAWGVHRGMRVAPLPRPEHAATVRTGAPTAAPWNESGEDATRRHIAAGLKAGDTDPATGRRILYYHDPMVPGNRFDKPAKSPFMDMMLSPVYADGEGDSSTVTINPRIQQNLGVRTAPVVEGALAPEVSAVGSISFNERDQVVVQARATGFVERLHARAALDRVGKGQALAEIYLPDWIAAQEEFLSVRRMRGPELAALVDGARQRMRQVGMSEAQIASVEATGRTQPRITLVAPIGGVITELAAREGMTVTAGTTLFRINGIATVWANAEVPESQSALVHPGAKVQARSPAAPGAVFDGQVQAILPEVNPTTRTVKARLEIANPQGTLAPGMFVQMQFVDMHRGKTLLIPTEAVIQTGRRTVAILAEDRGRFRPVEVEIGIESGGQTEVRRGLRLGQRVVVSAQFLIDSEASLKGVEARLNGGAKPDAAGTTLLHRGEARVERIGPDAITLSHGPVPSLQWGPMTMDFKLPPRGSPPDLAAGDRVSFEFYLDADNQPKLSDLKMLSPEPTPASASGTKP